ncbi:MAG TPA: protein-disulfide reductase DsbD domain-containing protein [Cytophagaceae bacterium]|jgi:hypothetical protein|nr:protein-disulfide reductase DsbD domain-containing protein [Cytophagaceae bacterium]
MRLSVVIGVLLFSGLYYAKAQTAKPIRWLFSMSKNEVKQGETVEIIMKAEINQEWYLYSSDFDADLGPTVSSITFVENGSYKVVGKLIPVGAKEKYDSLWGGKIRYFTRTAEFRQKVKILKTNPTLKAMLIYQVCSDKEGKCIPYEENILIDNLKVIAATVSPEKKEQVVATEVSENREEDKSKSKDRLSELESTKAILLQKDRDGNDIAVKQLRTFTQKYGGDK